MIKDLGIGFGAFVRLDRPLELKDNHLLNMGESFIIVNLITEKVKEAEGENDSHQVVTTTQATSTKLRLKLFGGPSTGEVFYFRPEQDHLNGDGPSTLIKIGRSNACDVVIEDAVLSKL